MFIYNPNDGMHPRLLDRAVYKFGGGGGGGVPDPGPAPSPIPRKVEVDIQAAKREQRELESNRRGRFASVVTRGREFGTLETSKSTLLGL